MNDTETVLVPRVSKRRGRRVAGDQYPGDEHRCRARSRCRMPPLAQLREGGRAKIEGRLSRGQEGKEGKEGQEGREKPGTWEGRQSRGKKRSMGQRAVARRVTRKTPDSLLETIRDEVRPVDASEWMNDAMYSCVFRTLDALS